MNRLFTLSALLCLTGCVSTAIVPVEKSASEGMQGRAITITHREKPSFAAMTAGKASFALIGAFAMISAGNAIVKENDIEDPAVRIAHELSDALIKAHALRSVDNTVTAASGDPAALAKQYPMADLLLDVQTINWSFAYFPTNWNHYRVIYSVKLRLIDTKSGKALADGFCKRIPDAKPDAPTHDQLLDDHAARLKHELSLAADQCIGELRDKVLGIH